MELWQVCYGTRVKNVLSRQRSHHNTLLASQRQLGGGITQTFHIQLQTNQLTMFTYNIVLSCVTSLLLLRLTNEPVDVFLNRLISALEPNLPLDEDLMGSKVGLNLSPTEVFLILSKVGTEPFFGSRWVWEEKAGWLAFLGILGSFPSKALLVWFFNSSRRGCLTRFWLSPGLGVPELPLFSATFASEIVGKVGTVGMGVIGVPGASWSRFKLEWTPANLNFVQTFCYLVYDGRIKLKFIKFYKSTVF